MSIQLQITKADKLYDHTLRYEHNEREEVMEFLKVNNVGYKHWNGGIAIVKKDRGQYIDPDYINGFGYFEVHWHKDIKQFINCQPTHKLESVLKSHRKAMDRTLADLTALRELKESI